MYVGAIGASLSDKLLENGLLRIQKVAEARQAPPAPASPQAVPTETARAEANASVFMLALMKPTLDGIYVVNAVGVKAGGSIKSISSAQNWSMWGF